MCQGPDLAYRGKWEEEDREDIPEEVAFHLRK